MVLLSCNSLFSPCHRQNYRRRSTCAKAGDIDPGIASPDKADGIIGQIDGFDAVGVHTSRMFCGKPARMAAVNGLVVTCPRWPRYDTAASGDSCPEAACSLCGVPAVVSQNSIQESGVWIASRADCRRFINRCHWTIWSEVLWHVEKRPKSRMTIISGYGFSVDSRRPQQPLSLYHGTLSGLTLSHDHRNCCSNCAVMTSIEEGLATTY